MSQQITATTRAPDGDADRFSLSIELLLVAAIALWVVLGRIRAIMSESGFPSLLERSLVAVLPLVLGSALAI